MVRVNIAWSAAVGIFVLTAAGAQGRSFGAPSSLCAQAPAGTPVPVVTEARRQEILNASETLTSETLADVVRKAEAGDVEAQVLAGIALLDGKVVPADAGGAVRWLRLAAENNHPMGQNMLGNAYVRGQGVPQDPQKAVEWYTKAAAQGYAQAQCNLGRAHFDGLGVRANPTEAVRLFRLAAEQGNADGQMSLGYAYGIGRGVDKNVREAVAWYRKAAEQGHSGAQCYLAVAYVNGQGVRKDKAEAERWLKKSSDQGNAVGSFLHGLINFEKAPPGMTDPIGTLTGINSWRLSAEQGNPVAAFALGELYTGRLFKFHVTKNDLEACTWYAIASNLDRQSGWETQQPEAVAQMRKDLPGRIEKTRKTLGAVPYAECERQATDWMTARAGRRQQ